MLIDGTDVPSVTLKGHPAQITQEFGWSNAQTPFPERGVMWHREVWTRSVVSRYDGPFTTLGDVLEARPTRCRSRSSSPTRSCETWEYLKGREARGADRRRPATPTSTREGAIAFPEPLDNASRTILTGEGGTSPVPLQARRRDRGREATDGSPRWSSSV